MFTGTLTASTVATTAFTGTIHNERFDIAINIVPREKQSPNAPDYDVTAVNRSNRTVIIGKVWEEQAKKSGNTYLSMQMDVGAGQFRVNAVQTEEQRKAGTGEFEIIPFISQGTMNSSSMSGELTAMDADNAFTGFVANMLFDMAFILVENNYKSDDNHPDYKIEVSSPNGTPIRIGSAWMQQSKTSGNDYITLLINTPDGELRVNCVQNEEQRGGNTFSIIPFISVAEEQSGFEGLKSVA